MRDYDSRYSDDYEERPSRTPRRSSSAYSDNDYDAPVPRRASSASRYSNPYDDDRYPSSNAGGGYVGGRSRGSTYSNPYADDAYSGGRSSRTATGTYNTSSFNSNNRSSYTGAYDTGYTNRPASGSSYEASSRSSQASYNTGTYANPYATSSRGSASRSSATGAYDTGAINRTATSSTYGGAQRSSQASYNTGTYNTGYTSTASRSARSSAYGSGYDDYGNTASRSARSSTYGSSYDDYGSTANRSSRGSTYGSGYDDYGSTASRSSARSNAYGNGYDDYGSTTSRSSRGSTYGNGYDDYGNTTSRSARGSAYGTPSSRSRANAYSSYDDDDDYGGRSSRRSSSAKLAVQKKNKALNIWLVCLSGLLVISIAMAFLLPEMLRAEAPPPTSNSAPEDTYDMNASPLPLAELGDTVLAASEDGGAEYIANTLFIGDDNVERMLDYATLSEMLSLDNCIGIGGMSVQAIPSFGCVQFEGQSTLATIPEAITLMQPLRILFAYGGSDATSAVDVDGFVSSCRIALESVRAAYSYADVIVCAIPPVAQANGSNSAKMTAIDVYNVQLARLAQELGLKFLNVSEALKDPATGYCQSSYTVEDSPHLNEAGLTAMINYARSHTNITEDTRPKPLKNIPKRVSESDTSSDASSTVASSLAASSAAASATSSTDGVKVVFSTLEHVQQSTTIGGKIQVAGQTTNAYTVYLQPGATCPTAVAVPASGYRFVYWACSVGSIANRENTTLANFVVSPTLKKGDILYITAIFEGIPTTPTNYNISISVASGAPAGANASVSPSSIPVGGTAALSATPVEGYTVIFAVSSGNATVTAIDGANATLTLGGAGDVSVVATYVPSSSSP